jgi:hypothetical protein
MKEGSIEVLISRPFARGQEILIMGMKFGLSWTKTRHLGIVVAQKACDPTIDMRKSWILSSIIGSTK